MLEVIFMVSLHFIRPVLETKLDEYCIVDTENTPCKYKCSRNRRCGITQTGFKVLTDQERECVVDQHNKYRNDAAGGKWTENGISTVSNMMALSYDKESEFLAGCYIKQCFDSHDKIRLSINGQVLGQNYIFVYSYHRRIMNCSFLKTGVDVWIGEEVKSLNVGNTAKFATDFQPVVAAANFTQALWASTLYVGCAMMHSFRSGGGIYNYDLFCNYRPAGNLKNEHMYEAGEPGSACAARNEKYSNLCGNIRALSEDTYTAPMELNKHCDNKSKKAYFILVTIEDYCKLGSDNTPCYYKCGRSSKCGETKGDFKVLTDVERECILEEHNSYRNDGAGGKWSSFGINAMANAQVLSYDKEVEFFAGCYIKQCASGHDKTRKSLSGKRMGQNIFSASSTAKMNMDCDFLKRSLKAWVDGELKFLNTSLTASFTAKFVSTPNIGHLTQVLWADTQYVGCAMLHSHKSGKTLFSYDVYCNYMPSGNVRLGIMYNPGDAGSSCSAKNDKYPNLCGNIRPISEDKYVPPISLSKYQDIRHVYIPTFLVISFLFPTIL